MKNWIGLFFVGITCFSFSAIGAAKVELNQDRLVVDGKPAPYLFGAELQYFRARGGATRNIPEKKVLADWNKLIDRAVEAKMNVVSLYVPWDFHEPLEGKFDFDGATIDQDKDGNPDYPSRNLKGFIDLLVAKGIRTIMVRPGPYINAEWGPTEFGAVPHWFLKNYPQGLAGHQTKGRQPVASFNDPIFRTYVQRWFKALYENVLKNYVGAGKPVVMLQLDNETNYFFDSLYERDYSLGAIGRYQAFLQQRYKTIDELNKKYQASFKHFGDVDPPRFANDARVKNPNWHYDWNWFHDVEIQSYYRFLKKTWVDLGIKDSEVLFTSCDSFNAPKDGLLPRLDYRQVNQLSLTTLNIYPKTEKSYALSTLNNPMKGAHDAVLVSTAHRSFYGQAGNWLLSTETAGGWFPDKAEVSLGARQHTYGSLFGTGVKAMILYYFHEGWNWSGEEKTDTELKFDAPLNARLDPNPRPSFDKLAGNRTVFDLVKEVGAKLQGNLGTRLVSASPANAPVTIVRETHSHYNLPNAPRAVEAHSTESAGLYGLLREAGAHPDMNYLETVNAQALSQYALVAIVDPGYLSKPGTDKLNEYLENGGSLLYVGDRLPNWITSKKGTVNFLTYAQVRDWNTDTYLTSATVKKTLTEMKTILSSLDLPIIATASDGNGYLHAWLRWEADRGYILFVENFLRQPRKVRIKIPNWKSDSHWTNLFNGGGTKLAQVWFTNDEIVNGKVELPVSADGVDIWAADF